ncbi:MAG: hypothetical protein ABIN58_02505, partial [candidate division WOR-3 bacterium]
QTHPDQVNYSFPGTAGTVTISYQIWDVDLSNEVEIYLNGAFIAYTAVTGNEIWSDTRTIVLPDAYVLDSGTNILTFKNHYNPPALYWWGVREVSLHSVPGAFPLPEAGAYGFIMGGDQTHPDQVNYSFPGTAGTVTISYQIWDVDLSNEVEIYLNGIFIAYASVTGNEIWSDTRTIALPDAYVLDSGTNILTFKNHYNPPYLFWWGIREVELH